MSDNNDSPIERIHKARAQEIATTFAATPDQAFDRALELGAGDCFQGRLLRRFVRDLTCTDFQFELLDTRDPSIRYLQCDAEKVDEQFAGERFDLVFSSNMIQHTPDQHAMLTGISRVLSDDGILILVTPNCCWKIFKVSVFYALLFPRTLKKVYHLLMPRRSANNGTKNLNGTARGQQAGNNPKFNVPRGRFRNMFLPTPLGAYRSNVAELFAFRRSTWVRKIHAAGFEMINVFNGPFIIGDISQRWNQFFGRMGLCTQFIYVAKKQGHVTRHESLFISSVQLERLSNDHRKAAVMHSHRKQAE